MNTVIQASKFFLFVVATFLSLATIQAQTKTITGKVELHTNNSGDVIASGAKVCTIGLPIKCVNTDMQGQYSIDVPMAEAQLKFSVTPDESNPNPETTEAIPANNKINATIFWTIGA